ncbi:hypothetical protein Dsin_014706 [Dipteronia sinensis]|uniref:RPN1 N-terminal domain-containing protein n=1 Tax=Dipteronia sinensis TaxID=43782 RepID=A0AAE0AMB6_9ROSI|nr:hypothetical protein Dsin_014706 [Dipteronia sinensis]
MWTWFLPVEYCPTTPLTTPLPDKTLVFVVDGRLQKFLVAASIFYLYYFVKIGFIICRKDTYELPDYHDIIAHPMDFTRWRSLCQLGIFRVLGSYFFFLDCILRGDGTREAVKKKYLTVILSVLALTTSVEGERHLYCVSQSSAFNYCCSIMPRPEAVDLLIEVQDLDLLVEHVDITNFKRTSLRHQFGKVPSWS